MTQYDSGERKCLSVVNDYVIVNGDAYPHRFHDLIS